MKHTRSSLSSWTESGLFGFILGLHLLGFISPTGSNELYDTIYTLENPCLGPPQKKPFPHQTLTMSEGVEGKNKIRCEGMERKRMNKLRWGGSVKRKNKIRCEGVERKRID